MDMIRAAGAPIIVKMPPIPGAEDQGERTVTLGRLRQEQIAELMAYARADTGQEWITLYDLDKYVASPAGADRALLMSLKNQDDKADNDDVKATGSIMQRCDLASYVFRECITNGEEALITQEKKKQRG